MIEAADRFARIRELHRGFLILPDIGDVLSAVMAAAAGFPAIGTSSVGLGLSLGCPGSRAVPLPRMLDVLRAITQAVDVPVLADLENGYGATPEAVGEAARQAVDAGAAGFNIEDSSAIPGSPLIDLEVHVERITAAREACGRDAGGPMIVGRTDPFWLDGELTPTARLDIAIERANRMLAAGADGVFISSRQGFDLETVSILAKNIDGPFHTLISPRIPSVEDYEQAGVIRLQTGSLSTRLQAGVLGTAFRSLRERRVLDDLSEGAMPTPEINRLVAPGWQRAAPSKLETTP